MILPTPPRRDDHFRGCQLVKIRGEFDGKRCYFSLAALPQEIAAHLQVHAAEIDIRGGVTWLQTA